MSCFLSIKFLVFALLCECVYYYLVYDEELLAYIVTCLFCFYTSSPARIQIREALAFLSDCPTHTLTTREKDWKNGPLIY